MLVLYQRSLYNGFSDVRVKVYFEKFICSGIIRFYHYKQVAVKTMGNKAGIYLVAVLVLMAGMVGGSAIGDTIFVKVGGSGSGTSWADAYGDLQEALEDAAVSGKDIWVAAGTYKPTSDYGLGIGDRGRHFRMINGVGIYGGFAAVGDPAWEDRDPNMYVTILSGDLLGNDNPATLVEEMLDDPCRVDNCYHVFYHPDGMMLEPNAILDGFAIAGGNADWNRPHHRLGGGMCNENSSPTVIGCFFCRNSAEFYGGGVYNEGSSMTVIGCIFNSNAAKTGGGMFNINGRTTLSKCIFIGNQAYWGGGMYNKNSSSPVAGCIFSGNLADYDGGGMFNYDSNPMVTDCTFSGNLADNDDGGGMFNYGSNPIVTNCTFRSNSSKGGGGMYNWISGSMVRGCTFSENTAVHEGGGMFNMYASDPNVTGCIFSGNLATDGGGMYNYESNLTVRGCVFTENTARDGGGMENILSRPLVTNCTFSGNKAYYYPGGGNGGGMLNMYASDPNVTGCNFIENLAIWDGGGICNRYSSSPYVMGCIFRGNLAYSDGGGIENYDSKPTVTGCGFYGNWAGYGGGMSNWESGCPLLTNCVFSGNQAEWRGGGLFNWLSDPNLTGCSFNVNLSDKGGGIENTNNSNPSITNCILWGNTASSEGNEIFNNLFIPHCTPVISHCDIADCLDGGSWDALLGVDGGGNIDVDPLFVDADGADDTVGTEDDDLHLRSYSPCIDKGDPAGDYSGQVDMDGEPRVRYDYVDMGADEVYPIAGDFEPDEDIDLVDLGAFFNQWLNISCVGGDWCGGADFDKNGAVNLMDFSFLANHWLKGIL